VLMWWSCVVVRVRVCCMYGGDGVVCVRARVCGGGAGVHVRVCGGGVVVVCACV